MKKAFTLVELLVVMAILALLMSVLLPALAQARQQARIAQVNAELYQIGLGLESYALDHKGQFPPTRMSCMMQEHLFQQPDELVQLKYLPEKPDPTGAMSSAMEDPFYRGHTYKYQAVGAGIQNGLILEDYGSQIWIPDGFPDLELESGKYYSHPQTSPVRWVVYSVGPNFNLLQAIEEHYPVSKESWYEPDRQRGVFNRIRLREGRQVGTFAGK